MLTSINVERNVNIKADAQLQSNNTKRSNVLSFKSSEVREAESRQKAIEAIQKRTKQLHW